MSYVGGSIEQMTLDGRKFPVAADSDSNRKLSGTDNEVRANGDGTARLIKTRMAFNISGLKIAVDDIRGDHEYLQELANRKDFFPVTVSYASGAIFQGNGQLVDEFAVSSQDATAELSLAGTGALTKQ